VFDPTTDRACANPLYFMFEVQFHTARSWASKTSSRGIYKECRELYDQLMAATARRMMRERMSIPLVPPQGALGLGETQKGTLSRTLLNVMGQCQESAEFMAKKAVEDALPFLQQEQERQMQRRAAGPQSSVGNSASASANPSSTSSPIFAPQGGGGGAGATPARESPTALDV
jgi:hypothetical protein